MKCDFDVNDLENKEYFKEPYLDVLEELSIDMQMKSIDCDTWTE